MYANGMKSEKCPRVQQWERFWADALSIDVLERQPINSVPLIFVFNFYRSMLHICVPCLCLVIKYVEFSVRVYHAAPSFIEIIVYYLFI